MREGVQRPHPQPGKGPSVSGPITPGVPPHSFRKCSCLESYAPGGRSVSAPRGRCRLEPRVDDQRRPLPPLSRAEPPNPGPGRQGLRPAPTTGEPGSRGADRLGSHGPRDTRAPQVGEARAPSRGPGVGLGRRGWGVPFGGDGPRGSGGGALGGGVLGVGTKAGPETWRAGGGGLVFATAKGLRVYYKAELGGRGAGGSRVEPRGIQS